METANNIHTLAARDVRRSLLIVGVVYLLLMWMTETPFLGDTLDYVDSIKEFNEGRDYKFWEFGHLFWRPLGWATAHLLSPVTSLFVGSDSTANITLSLIWLNLAFGLLSALAMVLLLSVVSVRAWVVTVVGCAFVLAQAFINYAQTGCSYIPGLAMMILGTYYLARPAASARSETRDAILGGICLACAVCFWFLYIWGLPAAFLTGLFLKGFTRERWRAGVWAGLAFGAVSGAAYAVTLVHLGIFNLTDLRKWISPSGAPPIRGFSRMVFGFARSLINMGNDAPMLKRFLLKDPLNAVTFSEIFRLSLWKLGLFYLTLSAVVFELWRERGRRSVLGLFVVGGIFVVGFAIFFLGGDLERYFPLYPFLFVAIAVSLRYKEKLSIFNFVTLAFLLVMTVTNVWALSRFAVNRQQTNARARLSEVVPSLKSGSTIFTATWQDELVNYNRSFPFDEINRNPNLRLNAIITPGAPWLDLWREDFARVALDTWERGGDVWISKRAFAMRPLPNWNWVEGDDKRISWEQLPAFIREFEYEQATTNDDGFIRLKRTENNRARLEALRRRLLEKKQ